MFIVICLKDFITTRGPTIRGPSRYISYRLRGVLNNKKSTLFNHL